MLTDNGPYAKLRVLLHWHTRYAGERLARQQVVVGPMLETKQGPDGYTSINVPFGEYDLKAVVDRLPAHQHPDLIVVVLDSTKTSTPRNLAAIDCPKALIPGDTHHLAAPIRYMLGVILAEPYDVLVCDHFPQHLHYFWHAGRGRIVWVPGIWVANYSPAFEEQRTGHPVFIGQTGPSHPYRQHVLARIREAGLPLETGMAPPPEAARLYSRAPLTLNCSLNGDFNKRVFEALGHGGFLVTDRLSPETGLSRIFPETGLVTYDGVDDLIETLRHYLAHPAEALAIARIGHRAYHEQHLPARKQRQVLSSILGDGRYSAFAWHDPRAETPEGAETAGLLERILVYEYLQEQQRLATGRLTVAALASVSARTLTDIADLSRLDCLRLSADEDAPAALIRRLGYSKRIGATAGASRADILLATETDMASGAATSKAAACGAARIVITDASRSGSLPDIGVTGYTAIGHEPWVLARQE